jgi:hypothetical protein
MPSTHGISIHTPIEDLSVRRRTRTHKNILSFNGQPKVLERRVTQDRAHNNVSNNIQRIAENDWVWGDDEVLHNDPVGLWSYQNEFTESKE